MFGWLCGTQNGDPVRGEDWAVTGYDTNGNKVELPPGALPGLTWQGSLFGGYYIEDGSRSP